MLLARFKYITGLGIYTPISNAYNVLSPPIFLKVRNRKVIWDAFFSLVQMLVFICRSQSLHTWARPFINQKLFWAKTNEVQEPLNSSTNTLSHCTIFKSLLRWILSLIHWCSIKGVNITRSKAKKQKVVWWHFEHNLLTSLLKILNNVFLQLSRSQSVICNMILFRTWCHD